MKKLLLFLFFSLSNLALAESLLDAVRSNKPDNVVARLLQQSSKSNIHAKDGYGNTAMHYLLALRSPTLVQQALQLQPDLNLKNKYDLTPLQFAYEFNDLSADLAINDVDLIVAPTGFTIKGKKVSLKQIAAPLQKAKTNRLIIMSATVFAHQWAQEQSLSQRLKWRAKEHRQQLAFTKWKESFKRRQKALQQPIAEIAPIDYPLVKEHTQSPFEDIAMFQNRINNEKLAREKEVANLQAEYRQKVEQRNKLVSTRQQALTKLAQEVKAKNTKNIVFAQRLEAKQKRFYANLDRLTEEHKPEFVGRAVAGVYGSPYFSPVGDAYASYDAEQKVMQLWLNHRGIESTKVKFQVPIAIAKEFFEHLQQGMGAELAFNLSKSGKIQISSIATTHAGTHFVANDDLGFAVANPLQVVIQQTSSSLDLQQKNIDLVAFDQASFLEIKTQPTYSPDVKFDTYVNNQQQKFFTDEIPALLKKAKKAPIDTSKWLFVIGAEKYYSTDIVSFSKRSAQMFAQVAAKTLGIQEGRQIVLLDEKATAASIKDNLRRVLDKKVRKGDTIYFYYSGHGIPVPAKGDEAYMLPVDKDPDYVDDDNDYFQVKKIYQLLNNSQAAKVFVFMDSCFTGVTDGKSVLKGKANTRRAPKTWNIKSNGKLAVLTAGNAKQYSSALPKRGHRLFSYYLMRAILEGKYRDIGNLAKKVQADVYATSLDLGGNNTQNPVLQGNDSLSF